MTHWHPELFQKDHGCDQNYRKYLAGTSPALLFAANSRYFEVKKGFM